MHRSPIHMYGMRGWSMHRNSDVWTLELLSIHWRMVHTKELRFSNMHYVWLRLYTPLFCLSLHSKKISIYTTTRLDLQIKVVDNITRASFITDQIHTIYFQTNFHFSFNLFSFFLCFPLSEKVRSLSGEIQLKVEI